MKWKADKKKIRPPARKEEKRGWQNSADELAMQQGERSDDEKSQATQCPLKPAGGAYKGIKPRADSGEAGEQVEMKGG